jgi:hypothetical protein
VCTKSKSIVFQSVTITGPKPHPDVLLGVEPVWWFRSPGPSAGRTRFKERFLQTNFDLNPDNLNALPSETAGKALCSLELRPESSCAPEGNHRLKRCLPPRQDNLSDLSFCIHCDLIKGNSICALADSHVNFKVEFRTAHTSPRRHTAEQGARSKPDSQTSIADRVHH